MWYTVIIAAVLLVGFFIYQGAFSPFAKLQREFSKVGKWKALLYLQLYGWEGSHLPINNTKNKVWKVVFRDNPDVIYITYNGDLRESKAMKILCNKIQVDREGLLKNE